MPRGSGTAHGWRALPVVLARTASADRERVMFIEERTQTIDCTRPEILAAVPA